jgi:hypothetical protein
MNILNRRKRIYLIKVNLFFILIFFLLSCLGGVKDKNDLFKIEGESSDLIISKEKIDRNKSYEINFSLEKPVDRISINISSKYIPNKFIKKWQVIKNYFIFEKKVDISHFKNYNKKFTYIELGRNYNQRWDRKQFITILSDYENNFLKLDNSIYRIRFATFKDVSFHYEFKIRSKSKIILIK